MTCRGNFGSRGGSALLIVLGFLSFMVVSAVSFAIYMRAERMPSSALRRAVATRHLVKAALAEAISRIDDAVRDDPFPGLCATNANYTVTDNNLFYYFRTGSGGAQALDVWNGRVFMPPDPAGGTVDHDTRFAPVTETASALTLEGLGYLPPLLVNDARFLSRSSWTSSWQQFPFDAGRFVYTAINVSDFLDVNRVSANKPRSAEPGRRLSIAHLFDPNFDPMDVGGNNSYQGSSVENPDGAADQFDTFTGKGTGSALATFAQGDSVGGSYEHWSPVGANAPYVSMLDYNLALNSAGPSSFFTPLFYNWLADKKRNQSYYIAQGNGKGKTDMAVAMRQPFVADSWSTNETWRVDISTVNGQPFRQNLITDTNGRSTYDDVAQSSTTFMNELDQSQLVGFADYALLCDYLDHNNIPVSLALPCVERVPMVVGLKPPQFTPAGFTSSGDKEDGGKIWKFDPRMWFADQNEMDVIVAFPFRHGRERESRSYTAQALVKLVYAPAGATKATLGQIVRPSKADWEASPGLKMDASSFVFSGLSQTKSFTVPETVDDDTRACISGNGEINFTFADFPNQMNGSVEVLKQEEKKDTTVNPPTKADYYTVLVSPLDEKGAVAIPVGQEMTASAFNTLPAVTATYVPHVYVWVRVKDSSGKVVDLVPANALDDVDAAGRTLSNQISQDCAELVGEATTQAGKPAFEFIGTETVGLAFLQIIAGQGANGAVEWSPKAIYAVDPRFNAQPEHWYKLDNDNVSFADWLAKTKAALSDYSGDVMPDQDIFLFNSNQGFLQSIGEFGFLPRLHQAGNAVGSFSFTAVNRTGNGDFGLNANDVLKNFQYLCRSYNLSDLEQFYSRCAQRGIGRNSQREQLVNPHTDNLGIMMAALANTPYDYCAAAYGADENTSPLVSQLGNPDAPAFTKFSDARNFMFSPRNSEAKLQYNELVQIAQVIMASMGGIDLGGGNQLAAKVKDVVGSIDNVGLDASRLRNSVARGLKQLIRNSNGAIRPSSAWQTIWSTLWANGALNVNPNSQYALDANDDGSFKEIFGITLNNPLYTVDRKFLYSYWRDCFANNQQLFLIFVRAESSALGGPGEGTPAQLGGRAVALVWRDPDWSEGNGDSGRDRDNDTEFREEENKMRPHRTRVLFYHQFD